MDLHALPRRDLQALAKRNGVRANMTSAAMADALAALPKVDGIEEYVPQPVAEPTPAAEPVVQATAEEEEAPSKEEEPEKKISPPGRRVAWAPDVVITLDDSDDAKDLTADEDAEKAPGRRRATRRGRAEPVAAPPATRKRGKAEKVDAAAEAVPARATRARSQGTVVGDEEAPKARRTSRRAAAGKPGTEQEEGEKTTHGDASDVAMAAPVSSDEGGDAAEETEAAMDAQNEEQNAPEQSQEDEGEAKKVEEVMPARATRSRRKTTVTPVAEEEAPKARRASRRAVSKKDSTEQADEEKATQGDVSEVEAAVPALVSSPEENDAEAMDAQNEEQTLPTEEQSKEDEGETKKEDAAAEAVPARATRARRQRAVSSVAEEAMPARATRARRQKTVVSATEEEEAPKGRRTSRRAAARKTEQEEEEKRTQGDVSDMEADVPAPGSSDEEQNELVSGSEEMEPAIGAQNEETTLVEEPKSVARAETPMARTGTMQAEEEQQQDTVSGVETAVPASSSDEEGDCTEEIEASMDAQDEEQTEQVDEQSQEDEGIAADETPLVEEEPAAAEDYPSVEEQTDTVSGEEIQHCCEDTEMVPVEEVPEPALETVEATEEVDFTSDDDASEETEDCMAEEESPVAEDVESFVQEPLVDVQQCEATEEIHAASDDAEMVVPLNEVPHATLTSGEATEEVDFTSHVGHVSEENDECTAEEETPVAEDVDSSVQEPLADVQQCEATEEIHAVSDDTDMVVLLNEVPQATEELDFTSHDGHVSEENEECTVEEETPVADDVDSSVQFEATEEIHLASEDTEMLSVLESGEATEKVDFTSDDVHASKENEVDFTSDASEEVLQTADKTTDEQKHLVVDEVTNMAGHTSEENEEIHQANEDTEMVPVLESGEATEEVHFTSYDVHASEDNEVDFTSDASEVVLQSADKTTDEQEHLAVDEVTNMAGHTSEENEDCPAEDDPPVAENVDSSVQEPLVDVQQCEATEETHFAAEHTEMVPVIEELQATLTYGEVTEDVGFTREYAEEIVTRTLGEAAEEIDFTSDASEETEVPATEEVLETADKATEEQEDMTAEEVSNKGEAAEEVDFTTDASEETVVPASEEVFQTADKETEEQEDMPAEEVNNKADVSVEEEAVMATDEMLQSMDEGVDFYSDASEETEVTADKAIEEQEDMAAHEVNNKADVSAEEERVVATDEMPQSMDEDVAELVTVTVSNLWQATTDNEGAVKESGFTGEVEVGVVAVVTVDNLSQAMVTDSEGAVNWTADLGDVYVEEEEAVVVADEMPQMSVAMDKSVEEFVTVDNLSQATLTDESSVNESVFSWDLAVLSVEEEGVMTVDEMQPTSSTMNKTAEQQEKEVTFTGDCTPVVDTARDLSDHIASPLSANVRLTDDEWAVKDSAFSGDCTPMVVDTAKDFSDHIASPLSANVFEYATKSLSIDYITVKPMVSEADDVPLSIFSNCGGTEPMSVQQEKEGKLSNEFKPMVSEADDVPLWIFSNSGGDQNVTEPMSVQQKKEVKLGNEVKTFGSLSVRKLKSKLKKKVAVVQGNEADDMPLRIFSDSVGEKKPSEPMAVEQENESEALGSLSLRKLRTEFNQLVEVAQENEEKEGEKSSVPLDKLSLRKLKLRLKETLNAQKEPTRVPLGRLDENMC